MKKERKITMGKLNLEEATMKALEGKLHKKIESNNINYEDFIAIKEDNEYDSLEIFFFDHSLTRGEMDRIESAIDNVRNGDSDYDFSDIGDAINEVVPYIKSLTIDNANIIYV